MPDPRPLPDISKPEPERLRAYYYNRWSLLKVGWQVGWTAVDPVEFEKGSGFTYGGRCGTRPPMTAEQIEAEFLEDTKPVLEHNEKLAKSLGLEGKVPTSPAVALAAGSKGLPPLSLVLDGENDVNKRRILAWYTFREWKEFRGSKEDIGYHLATQGGEDLIPKYEGGNRIITLGSNLTALGTVAIPVALMALAGNRMDVFAGAATVGLAACPAGLVIWNFGETKVRETLNDYNGRLVQRFGASTNLTSKD